MNNRLVVWFRELDRTKKMVVVAMIIAIILAVFWGWWLSRESKPMAFMEDLSAVEKRLDSKIEAVNRKVNDIERRISSLEECKVEKSSSVKKSSSATSLPTSSPRRKARVEERVVTAPRHIEVAPPHPRPRVEEAEYAGAPAPTRPAPPPSVGMLLWHPYDASDRNPKPCIVSAGNGMGLPARCSSFEVIPAKAGETKNEWLVRVGGGANPTDTGSYRYNKG